MRRHLTQAEAAIIHRAIADAIDQARATVQARAAEDELDLKSVDWEIADAAHRWGMALREELAPGPRPELEPEPPGPIPERGRAMHVYATRDGRIRSVSYDDGRQVGSEPSWWLCSRCPVAIPLGPEEATPPACHACGGPTARYDGPIGVIGARVPGGRRNGHSNGAGA